MDQAAHIELWSAVATVAFTVAAALWNLGRQYGRLQTKVEMSIANQTVIAEHLGIPLPYPGLAAKKIK